MIGSLAVMAEARTDTLVTAELLDRLAGMSSSHPSGPARAVISPFSEAEIASVADGSVEDVMAAVARARSAQARWAMISPDARARVLHRYHDVLIERADEAMDLIQLEAGKSRIAAFEEVYEAIATARYYAKTGPRLVKRRRRAVSLPFFTKTWEYRHPLGVVGNITPWNFPFTLSVSDILAALIAGNAVVVKPDEKTPFSALYGKMLLDESGLPEDLFLVVPGPGPILGPALIDAVDFVSFTGSSAIGQEVAARAGARLIPSSMELGGKNAAIVMADADLAKTIPAISRAVYANGGQLCIAMERLYVDEGIRDEFTGRFVQHVRELPLTDRFDFSSALSPMIDRAHLSKVHSHVEDAVERGATLLTGGKPRPDVGPLFYEPTVLTDVDESMLVCSVETFGPVATIYGYSDIEEAIAAANESDYGLNFSVWTSDSRKGVEVASRLHAGTVGVNDGYAATWSSYDAPMGGWKSSGLSRRHGEVGLLKFTEPQTISLQRGIDAFAPFPGMDYDRYHRVLGPMMKLLKRLPFYK
ncbi:MAG: succinic semialdehyde dehydrogenase [Acidimicrobiia bacterium]|nr:succinic semialdehyde dehydrogenase [Acidimicrobiia bacterium]